MEGGSDTENEKAKIIRYTELQIVDWEAKEVTSKKMVFRILFEDTDQISVDEESTNTLYVTLNLESFKTTLGQYIPEGTQIDRNLPAQLPTDTAETYETIGSVTKWIYLIMLFGNFGVNQVFEELDF